MASVSKVLRTCGLLLYLIFQVHTSANKTSDFNIQSLKVGSVTCDNSTCKYLLNVSGGEFLGHYPWRLTSQEGAKGSNCGIIYPNYEIKEIETSQWLSKLEVSVPNLDGKIYFCLHQKPQKSPFGGVWMHQGVEHFLEPKDDIASYQKSELSFTNEPPKSDSPQYQKNELQATKALNDLTDENIVQKDVTNDNDSQRDVSNDNNAQKDVTSDSVQQEAKTDWADLTHDIDVNYLPSAPRPTREEKNDIEVLYHDKYVPLNDLIDQFKIDSKQTNNVFDDSNRVDDIKLNGVKSNAVTDNLEETIQEDKNRESISRILFINVNNKRNNLNSSRIKLNNTEKVYHKKIYLEEFETLKANLQLNKCDKIIEEVRKIIEGLNSLPNAKTVEDALARVFPNEKFVQNLLADFDIKENIEEAPYTFSKEKDIQELLKVSFPNEISTTFSKEKAIQDLLETSFPNDLSTQEAPYIRRPRQVFGGDFTSVRADVPRIILEGVRIEDSDKEPKIIEDGIPSVLAHSSVTLRVYGEGLTPQTVIAFTHDPQPYGQPCKFLLKGEYMVKEGSLQPRTALFDIRVPSPIAGEKLYICAKNLYPGFTDPAKDEEKYAHMGTETWKMLASHNKLLPLWVSISLILFCLMFSALFSGLNLGLMSLDRTELKIISNTGTEQERKYARAIMPVRDHGNYLLCSILLGNVAVNSTFTILLDELTSGLFAVIFSTLAIVLLGEITPQAICSRYGLMVGAKSIIVTKGVMAVTAPLSFPVSKLLDYFLGEEIGNVYNRERLKELVKVTTDVNDLDKEEVNIISGALEMRKKMVRDVMTKLEDVFMLPISSVLDFETMSEIVKSGYSRIPVYEGARGNIVTVLFIKDLAFVDPDDNTPLRTLCQYYQNAAHFVFEDVTLDVMFKQFKDGHKGHMAFVHRINNEGEGDPFYETIGLVTLEDVIEEMIQSEIVDETDVFLDNRSKRRRRPQNKLQDFAAFAERHENQRIHISPQLTLATFQFLSTSVDAFRPDTVSETVLRRLLRQDVIQYIKMKGKTKKDACTYVFQQGKPVDYFLLILEGRVEVTVGRENLVFEAGPFTYFGVQALTQNVGVAESPTPSAMGSLQNINMDAMLRHTFVPDYSVRAISSVYYLTVKRSLYLAAKRATLMEKGNISKGGTTQEFDTEVDKNLCNSSSAIPISMISKKLLGKSASTLSNKEDVLSSGHTATGLKLLQSVDEDLSITGEHKTPSRQVSPNPMPASPGRALEPRNGHAYAQTSSDEQERLLK